MEIIFVALAVMFLIGVLFIFFRKKKEDPDSQKETGEADTITQPPRNSNCTEIHLIWHSIIKSW